MFEKVLFPIDQSRETQEAVEVVIDVVKKYGSHLVLLSVVEESNADAPKEDVVMSSSEIVGKLLETAKTAFSQKGVQTETIERQGKPAFVICDVADEIEANLIIMGCRGLGLTDEGVHDSVTNRVINLSPCPVLIVP